jgi:hypothetical protein
MNHGAFVAGIKDNLASLSTNFKGTRTFHIKRLSKQNSGSTSPFLIELSFDGSTCKIKSRIVMAKAAFNKKKSLYQQIGLKFQEETSKMLHLEHGFVRC